MIRLVAMAVITALSGCINLYTRFPTSEPRIERVYQCSHQAAGLSIVASFPQMMSDCPSDNGFMVENLFTIPFLGLPCAVDAICEACIDTVCLPIDWPLSASRKED